ncbi:MAG: hypothetical protein E6K56_02855 [Ignavibacteria bacterium]|nr:MAG: hypothetical protein E6K56_02855 [Ignavibacteria bacterium]
MILLLTTVHAQPWRDNLGPNETNFYRIRDEFKKYWSTKNFNIHGGEEGNPWIPFKRWEWFIEPRVYPTGELPSPDILQKRMNEYRSSMPMQVAAGGNWTPIGPAVVPSAPSPVNGGEGRVNVIAVNPSNTNIIWAGSASGGLWKSTNSGSSWSTTTDNFGTLGISSIAFDPTNSNIMYVATGDADGQDTYSVGVLKSTDGGDTWNPTGLSSTTSQRYTNYAVVPHPTDPNILLAAGRQGIFRTTNAGLTWPSVMSGNFKDLEVDPSDPTVWYTTLFATGVYKSTNSGTSFTQLTSGLPPASSNLGRISVAVAASTPSTLYALYVDYTNFDFGFYGLYGSTNGGTSWSLKSSTPNILGWDNGTGGDASGGQGWYDLVLQVAPDNPATVYVGGVNLWKSTSSGTSWTRLTHWYSGTGLPYIHADQHGFTFLPGSASTILAGNDGGVFVSTNSGTSWTDRSAGIAATQFYRLGGSATNANRIYAGAQDNGTDRDLSGSWRAILDGDGMEALIDYSDENIGYGELYYGQIRKTTTGGDLSTTITGSIPDTGDWVTPYIINPINPKSLYVGEKGVYKTTNRGTSWTTLKSGLSSVPLTCLAIAPTDTNTLYAATTSQVWVSSNGGTVWSSITAGLPAAGVTYLAVSPIDPATAYATTSGYGSQKVYVTTDRGSSWSNISTGLPSIPVNCIAVNPSFAAHLYVGTDAGVYFSSNSGSSWSSFSTGLPNVIVNELEVQVASQKLRAATYGRGLWESPLAAQAPGSIAGMKFNDANDNGAKDGGEAGLANWTIQLTIASPPSVISTTTDVNGNYSFTGLQPGTYLVDEVQQAGWAETFPATPTYTIVMRSGLDTTGIDFGNFQGAQISGTVFEDINADTLREGGEPGLLAWRVRLSGTKTDSTLTDGSGNYSFANLIAGNYTVTELLQAGWHESHPASGSYSISISGGNQITGKDFGNFRYGSIAGLKFNDQNTNGIKDGGEPGIANWVLHLTGPVTMSALTELNGNYSFVNLVPGSYSVSESSRADWYQTLPPGNGSYAITLRSGLDTSGLLFGNHYGPGETYSVLDGWNLLSLPRKVPDNHRNVVYPSSISNAFAYAAGYQRIDTLSPGFGFWLKFSGPQSVPVHGDSLRNDTVNISAGWNMIGSLTTAIPVSAVVQIPPGIVSSRYFSYGNSGYQVSDSLIPQQGNWVRAGSGGKLAMSSGASATPAVPPGFKSSSSPPLATLTVSDSRGRQRTLYFSFSSGAGLERASYELPPSPPPGGFDVRYAAGGSLAYSAGQKAHDFPITISSADFPLNISWELAGEAGTAELIVDQREFSLMGNQSVRIGEPPSKIVLRIGLGASAERPARFSLEQNYPNPFNPTTQVATIVDEVKEPGAYQVEWDAKSFPSGVYTCRMQAGAFSNSKKVVLLR